jgi:tRNA(fMet)-specific endonuclease VapC
VITAFELLGWARTPEELARIERWLAGIRVFELDLHSARTASAIQRTLGSAGLTIGPRDTLIAGIAVANDLPLLTRNVSEFERVPGLQLVRLG